MIDIPTPSMTANITPPSHGERKRGEGGERGGGEIGREGRGEIGREGRRGERESERRERVIKANPIHFSCHFA